MKISQQKKELLLNCALIGSFLLTGFSLWLFFKDSNNKKNVGILQQKELNIIHQKAHCPKQIPRACCEGNYCGEINQCPPSEMECNGQETKNLAKCNVIQWKNPKFVLCSFCKNTIYYTQAEIECIP